MAINEQDLLLGLISTLLGILLFVSDTPGKWIVDRLIRWFKIDPNIWNIYIKRLLGFQKNVGVGDPDFSKNNWISDGPDRVARSGIKAMQAGKSVVVPGFLNKLLITIQRLLPRSVVTLLVRRIQERNRRFVKTGINK